MYLQDEEGTSRALPPFVSTTEDLLKSICLNGSAADDIARVSRLYPFRIPRFYLDLADKGNPHCPILRQAVPLSDELRDGGDEDPLGERSSSVTPVFVQKYPGRGVFLVSNRCAMYCRFCNRKRMTGKGFDPAIFRDETFAYLETHPGVREVIVSGGDPFMLQPEELDDVVSRLRGLGSVDIIRISTRMPVVWPDGMREGHFRTIERNAPLWVVVHINHPRELSARFYETLLRLRRAGAVIVSQTVLLRGVNDCPHILLSLFEGLVRQGVKPYYLFQLDEVRGASHFKVRLDRGIEIMRFLRANASGLAIPSYAIDITGGSGKVLAECTQAVRKREGGRLYLEGPLGAIGAYQDDGDESVCLGCGLCKRSA